MEKKTFKVRKGIETDPRIWGLLIPYFFIVTVLASVVIMSGFLMVFMNLQGKGGGWKIGLYILAFGCPAVLVLRSILKSLSKPNKHKFGKKTITLSNHDLLQNL